jgi:hypothetical protein
MFVTVGSDPLGPGTIILTSIDATNWSSPTGISPGWAPRAVTFGEGQFVAIGGNAAGISTDGTNWTRVDLRLELGWPVGVTYGGGKFVAIGGSTAGSGSSIITSTDGTNWIQQVTGITNTLAAVTYGNGQFVAVGGDRDAFGDPITGTVFTSVDAVTWLPQRSGTDLPLTGVAYGNGYFVAAGFYGVVIFSRDGVHWDQRSVGSEPILKTVTYADGHFFIGAWFGGILQSDPIVSVTLSTGSVAGPLSLSLEGPAGLNYTIQSSTDLVQWQDVTTIIGSPSGRSVLPPQLESKRLSRSWELASFGKGVC